MSRKQRIHDLLFTQFKPEVLLVENESNRHHVPEGSETHFKIVVVSENFKHLNRIARHRQVNTLIAPEFTVGLHALSLHLYTPAEWQHQAGLGAPSSPACRNGKNTKLDGQS